MTKVILLLFILLAVGIFFGVFVLNFSQPSYSIIYSTHKLLSQANLKLMPDSLTTVSGKTTYLQVEINATGTPPSLVQFELSYNPLLITNIQITPGDFFPNPVVQFENVDKNTGRISYAVSESQKSNMKKSGRIALIAFTPYAALSTQTEISFLPKTMLRSSEQENILKSTTGATIIITPDYSQMKKTSSNAAR